MNNLVSDNNVPFEVIQELENICYPYISLKTFTEYEAALAKLNISLSLKVARTTKYQNPTGLVYGFRGYRIRASDLHKLFTVSSLEGSGMVFVKEPNPDYVEPSNVRTNMMDILNKVKKI